jgi:ABC-type amino acid transport substrate-binding protein
MADSPGGSGILGRIVILLFFMTAVCGVLGLVGLQTMRAPSGSSRPGALPGPASEATPIQPGAEPAPGGAAVARIRTRGSLVVGMDTGEPPWTGTPPMYFRNEAGENDGFDYTLATVIARDLGVEKVDLMHGKYSDLPGLLTDPGDKIDLLISGYSPAEEPGISWSDSYLEYGLCLVVPSKSKVKSVADLFGKPVGIFDDDAAAADVQKLVKGYTELVRLEDGYWDQLLQGRFAGFIYDYPYAVAEINDFYAENPHRKGAFRIAQYNLTDSTYAVGVRQGEPDLLAAVNGAIKEWRGSPAYEDAIKRYLSGGIAVEAPADAKHVHVVVAGDTLSGIAAKELGDMSAWPRLWELNKERFPNPHLIEIGDKVVLP